MPLHLAFLRGINVSGQKIIKMTELAAIFEDAGFQNVKTILASGNVVFESSAKSTATLTKKIESTLAKALGYEVDVMLRTLDEMRKLFELKPFGKVKAPQATRYVTFLAEPPDPKLKLPPVSPKKNVEFILIRERDIFSISHKIERGDYANPIIEKQLHVKATTRNWNTIEKILSL
jgi:uncharacterized protein (DUF1697 family)